MRSRVNNFPFLSEDERFLFPHPDKATPEGILAVGGNLSPGMLLSAYGQGVFPWFSENEPVLWWSPDPRFVLFPRELRVSESMKKVIRKGLFTYGIDTRFRDVVTACSRTPRPGQNGTWITEGMIEGYSRLHELGYAHSVEVYSGCELVGGLYGVSLGRVFFGESMFTWKPNASKAAFLLFGLALGSLGFDIIDSQVSTAHMESMGGRYVSRKEYLGILKNSLEKDTLKGDWKSLFPEFPRSEWARGRGLFST
jgi:leucyl/phenylalanyl-tRNA--protein transferase